MKNQAGIGLFALALLSFLLPWVNITCGEQTIARFSGVDLLTGKQMGEEMGRSDPNVWVILAALFVVGGLVFALLRKPPFPAAILGGAAAAAMVGFLIDLNSSLNAKVAEKGSGEGPDLSGMISAEYQAGFYLCLLACVAAALLPVILDRMASGAPKPGGEALPPPAPPPPPPPTI